MYRSPPENSERFEHEFEDLGDAIGDLAETCATVILFIFLMTFLVDSLVSIIGPERLGSLFAGRGYLTVIAGAIVGLIPGTGASLAFTSLYFSLADTPGAMPFAALAACSIALIGDSQFVGNKMLRHSQRARSILLLSEWRLSWSGHLLLENYDLLSFSTVFW